jgi:glycosyltransferase involved in cell wall biosynthesis
LPRAFRHPAYDNLLFPKAISKLKPDFVFSPYHDVRLPRNIPSVMMIHDTCIGDLPGIYPFKVRSYYQTMLRINLSRAKAVLTVSEASKSAILQRYKVADDFVHVVYNTLDKAFLEDNLEENSQQPRRENGLNMFYTGGNEYRKNVGRLLDAVANLLNSGHEPWLWVTGIYNEAWQASLDGRPFSVVDRVKFVGRLSLSELRAQYLAADVVVYPSLCEGFGRACLEAMVLGVPIACSDIPPLREVAGDSAFYFNPLDVISIASQIVNAASVGHKQPLNEPRFNRESVINSFAQIMNSIVET